MVRASTVDGSLMASSAILLAGIGGLSGCMYLWVQDENTNGVFDLKLVRAFVLSCNQRHATRSSISSLACFS